MSCETTFRATSNRDELIETIRQLSADLSEDLVRHGVAGRTVTLKYKTAAFDVKTRATQLTEHTTDGAVIAKAAVRLLTAEAPDVTMRLLGVRMSQLTASSGAGSGAGVRKQRTLDRLLVECPAKRRKLDEAPTPTPHDEPASFTCPVCHSWRTADGDVALNRHIDECLNQQVLLAECGTSGGATRKPSAKHHSAAQSKLDRFFTRK